MRTNKINDHFTQAAQISPAEVKEVADAGFKGIICARPDNEDAGQPAFATIAAEAEKLGLKAYHIPVSGPLTEGQLIRFAQAKAEIDGPIFGYCRSGARAGSLYAATA